MSSVCLYYFSGIKNGHVLAFIHYIFLAAGAPFATCKVSTVRLYGHIILAFNAMGGREKGREGTLEKCGELYFSVGCSLNVTKTRSGYSQTPLS